jgi:hypothetical protein
MAGSANNAFMFPSYTLPNSSQSGLEDPPNLPLSVPRHSSEAQDPFSDESHLSCLQTSRTQNTHQNRLETWNPGLGTQMVCI